MLFLKAQIGQQLKPKENKVVTEGVEQSRTQPSLQEAKKPVSNFSSGTEARAIYHTKIKQ